jgi:hypothetical protein
MDEKDKIFADPAQRAVLRNGDASLNYYTLDEAVRAWQMLPEVQRARATIKAGNSVYDASQIDRLHVK